MTLSKTKSLFYYLFCFIAIVPVALSIFALGEVSLSTPFKLLWFSISMVYYYPVAILVWLAGIVLILIHYKLVRFLAQTDEQIVWVPVIVMSTWLSIIILVGQIFVVAFSSFA